MTVLPTYILFIFMLFSDSEPFRAAVPLDNLSTCEAARAIARKSARDEGAIAYAIECVHIQRGIPT